MEYLLKIAEWLLKKVSIDGVTLSSLLSLLMNIPKTLKITLGIVITIGIFYYGYKQIYQTLLNELKEELQTLEQELDVAVNVKDYSSDIYYLITAIQANEEALRYSYEEGQLLLLLILSFLLKHHPDDAILYDIDAMIKRNERNYQVYKEEIDKALKNCRNTYIINDSVPSNK